MLADTAEDDPRSEHTEAQPDQDDTTLKVQVEKQQDSIKQLKLQVEKQQDSIKQLEQLLTDQRMVQEGGITDSRENFALVCAQNFGFAQGGVPFAVPGQRGPFQPSPLPLLPTLPASGPPGSMTMAPLSRHGHPSNQGRLASASDVPRVLQALLPTNLLPANYV